MGAQQENSEGEMTVLTDLSVKRMKNYTSIEITGFF